MNRTLPYRYCLLLLAVGWGLLQVGCREDSSSLPAEELVTAAGEPVSKSVAKQTTAPASKLRNVILLIGDGMGPQQLGLLYAYSHLAPGSKVPDRTSAIELLAQHGGMALVRTESYGTLVVESAAAATQLASGEMAGAGMIGANYRGESVSTVLEIAKQLGKSTGLVSDTRITHATPAAFAAHQPYRSMENEIASDMLENQVDVLMSGGLCHWVPELVNDKQSPTYLALVQMIGGRFEPTSKRQDNRNLLVEARLDYQLVFDHKSLAKVKKGRVLGLFADSEMLDALDERNSLQDEGRTEPTLAEMTDKALELLSENPAGFFLMVEGGQIDWCGHSNDAGCMLHELLQFDEVVRLVYQWAQDRDDTLVLITADHETGSFGFSYSDSPLPEPKILDGDVFRGAPYQPNSNYVISKVLDHLYAQQHSFEHVFREFESLDQQDQTAEALMQIVNRAVAPYAITQDDAAKILADKSPYDASTAGRMNHLGYILGEQQNVVWGTGGHTNTPVPLITFGPPSATEQFKGILHSTDIGKKMIAIIRGN
jgi:alkaline phosphatase